MMDRAIVAHILCKVIQNFHYTKKMTTEIQFTTFFCTFVAMKQAMVFAAGLGTRLKPLTDTMPKALVRVGDQPLLAHVVLKLKQAGFTRIIINVHHFAEQIIDYLEEHHNFGIDIIVSDERAMLLETGGGIKKAIPYFHPEAPILIHNVDILSNVDLADFYEHARCVDAMLLVSQRKTKRYLMFQKSDMQLCGWTNIETGEVKGKGLSQAAQANLEETPHLFAFSGIHVLSPRLFPLMGEFPDRFSIIDFYLRACETNHIKAFLKSDLRLMDVGKLDTLHEAEQFLSTI